MVSLDSRHVRTEAAASGFGGRCAVGTELEENIDRSYRIYGGCIHRRSSLPVLLRGILWPVSHKFNIKQSRGALRRAHR